MLLGLLTYKPQFGLLFPLALIADRRWLTIAVAAAVASAMAAASWLVFGAASWQAFFHWLPITSHRVLGEGVADFDRLQSFYGLVRAHDGSETLAFAVQAIGSIAAAIGIVWLWRSRAPFDLKAAALAAATLVATPYVYMYDVTVLAVAVGFLLRYALYARIYDGGNLRPHRGRGAHSGVSLRQDADRSCRRADRAGAGR